MCEGTKDSLTPHAYNMTSFCYKIGLKRFLQILIGVKPFQKMVKAHVPTIFLI